MVARLLIIYGSPVKDRCGQTPSCETAHHDHRQSSTAQLRKENPPEKTLFRRVTHGCLTWGSNVRELDDDLYVFRPAFETVLHRKSGRNRRRAIGFDPALPVGRPGERYEAPLNGIRQPARENDGGTKAFRGCNSQSSPESGPSPRATQRRNHQHPAPLSSSNPTMFWATKDGSIQEYRKLGEFLLDFGLM